MQERTPFTIIFRHGMFVFFHSDRFKDLGKPFFNNELNIILSALQQLIFMVCIIIITVLKMIA